MASHGGEALDLLRQEPILTGRRRAIYFLGIVLWVVSLLFFWVWWLNPNHIDNLFLYMVITAAMAWATLSPLHFAVYYTGAGRPHTTALTNLRVAMVVTKAPSEPFAVIARTLEAMLAQDYPHDTWLADEDPMPETRAWCEARGVMISTRKGCVDYHRTTWPRRTKCKEGNLAYFYDHYGYDRYDVVVQLDADHVPTEGYLLEMLRPFADNRVGYVSAPSICDNNAKDSWSARGRLYAEGNMHAALQAGYSTNGAPLCFGSHYAVRTAALKSIGGLGPELAEDHSTSMMMVAHGWRGAHAIDAIAHGDGPATFADLATQEFQWSRSIVTILIRYSRHYLPMMPLRMRMQFIFSQLWYPLFSLFMALGYFMPLGGLVFQTTFADVSFLEFVVHAMPVGLILIALSYQWRSHGAFRPVDAKILSWESTVFQFARWPWSLLGCLAAVREWLTNRYVEFRITPKGTIEADPVPVRVLLPYALLATVPAIACLVLDQVGEASGYYLFAVFSGLVYGSIFILILWRHTAENVVRKSSASRKVAIAAAVIAIFALPATSIASRGLEGFDALSTGNALFSLTRPIYSPSGGGHGAIRRVTFSPRWNFDASAKEQIK